MRRGVLIFIVACAALTAFVMAPTIQAYNNGVPSSDLEYDCGGSGSCHDTPSTSIITMCASNMTPAPGDTITLWINVSGGEADEAPLGVMIVCATTLTNSMPSADGWTILADPSGTTTYNYYQVTSYKDSYSFSWQLSAPTALGIHMLFAREMHGDGGVYANDYSAGLMFVVTDYSDDGGDDGVTDSVPTLVITSPSNSATVRGNITVSASVVSVEDIASATLTIDGKVVGVLTEEPFTWTVDTTNMTEGGHVIVVTVVDSTGDTATKEIAVFVDNESELVAMLEWIVTMGAGTVAIICITGMMIVLALYIRKRVMSRRAR